MLKTLLIIIFIMIFMLTFNVNSSTLILYYNGTIISHVVDQRCENLVGNNISDLVVYGSKYNISNNKIYFYNITNITIKYETHFYPGVVDVKEPYVMNIIVIIPDNFTLNYVDPSPSSFQVVGKNYYIQFNSSNITLLYSSIISTKSKGNSLSLFYILIFIIIIVNILFGYLIYKERKVIKIKKNQDISTKIESGTEVELPEDPHLNDRDIMVLEAIKKGNTTLSDIVKYTKLPKTTTYRRIKKLISLGYIKEVKKDGRIFYIIDDKK